MEWLREKYIIIIYIYNSNDNKHFYSLRPNSQGNFFSEIKKGKTKVKK